MSIFNDQSVAMTAEEKGIIQKKIGEMLSQWEEKVRVLKELTQPIAPENAIGRVSRMDAINNKSVNEAALRQAELKVKKLNYSLTRIADAEFGMCSRCKQEIPMGRLLLMPESTRCVHCADR